jgi:hypothetical protein
MEVKRFKEFLKENKDDLYKSAKIAKKFGIDTEFYEIEVDHDFIFHNKHGYFEQKYNINGKNYYDQDEEGWFFLKNVAKEMGLEREEFENWFEDNYDFAFHRISRFHARGKKGDVSSIEVIEVEEAD